MVKNRIDGAFVSSRAKRRFGEYWTPEREAEYQRLNDEFAATPPERRPLTEVERSIIAIAISELAVGRAEAVAQLEVATYGGLVHAGTHVCFNIDVPDSAPRLPDGVPRLVTLDVDLEGTTLMSNIELYIDEGRLWSVDLTEINEHDELSGIAWPDLSRIHPFRPDPG